MPSPVFTAAIDLGATSGRVILGAWFGHRLTLREVHRFPNTFRTLGAHDYWDIGALWHEAQTGLRQAAAALPRGAKLASVGVDTWGVDYALLNDAGRLVFPVHAYRDARTQPGLRRLGNTRAALERIYAATGIPNVFYNASLQLEEVVAHCPAIEDLATRVGEGKVASNWMQQDVLRTLNERGGTLADFPVTPAQVADIIDRVQRGDFDTSRGREIFAEVLASGRSVADVVDALGIAAVSEDDLVSLCRELLGANPKIVADVKGGKEQAAAGLIGQAKKKNANVNPGKVRELCLRLIREMP
ncbi:MAG: hypothetical protein EBR23_05940 [Planctomycetia bacterium]|nr:hypothetical protein [Planctomycetia bacterium]